LRPQTPPRPSRSVFEILETVEDHHGEFHHEPPWSEIDVFGVELTDELEKAFGDLGVTEFERVEGGFKCRRTL
jgi:hypothetical protein